MTKTFSDKQAVTFVGYNGENPRPAVFLSSYEVNDVPYARLQAPDGAIFAVEMNRVSAAEQAPREAWFYDAASSTLYDENRLAVARGVGPDDAQTILKALGCEVDFAIVGEPQPNPLFKILDDMLAWEADQFDGDPDMPLDVSGADLVDVFTEWRKQLKAALAYVRPQPLAALATQAMALFREYERHHRKQAERAPEHHTSRRADRQAKAARNKAIADRLESALGGSVAYGPVLTLQTYEQLAAALRTASAFIETEVENRGAAGGEMTDYVDEARQAFEAVEAGMAALAGG